MSQPNKLRKKCQKCGRTFVVPVLVNACQWLKLGDAEECGGDLEMYSDGLEDSITNLLAISREIARLHRFMESELLEQAIEDLQQWTEKPEDPQQMGWVGSDGRP